MIHELRIDTLRPGRWEEFRNVAGEIVTARSKHSKCIGYWITKIGNLNQVVHLWEYDNFAHWTQVDEDLSKNEDWIKHLTPMRRCLISEESTILIPSDIWPFTLEPGNSIFELRRYTLRPGKLNEWLENLSKGLQARAKYSKPVGFWYSEVGRLNMIYHIWGYTDLQARADIRKQAASDPDWTNTLGTLLPLIQDMTNQILIPW